MDAIVSGSANVALLIEGDHCWSLRPTSAGIERVPQPHDLGHIFGEASDLAYLENTSEAVVLRELAIAHAGVKALHLALMLCDPETSVQAARLGGVELEALLVRPEVAERAERILDAKPMPKPLEVTIAMARCHTYRLRRAIPFFEELEARQPVIAEVRRAWDMLPSSLFTDGQERASADGLLAREGAFRSLVRARRDGGSMSRWIASTLRRLATTHRRIEGWLPVWVEGLDMVGERPRASFSTKGYQDQREDEWKALRWPALAERLNRSGGFAEIERWRMAEAKRPNRIFPMS